MILFIFVYVQVADLSQKTEHLKFSNTEFLTFSANISIMTYKISLTGDIIKLFIICSCSLNL